MKAVDLPKPIVCESCGQTIPADENGLVTKWVWRDGHSLCIDCNKKAAKGVSK